MTRKELMVQAYKNKEVEADTFGQLASRNFSDEAFEMAVERGWITKEFANTITGNNEEENIMKKTVITYTNRKSGKEYTLITADEQNNKAILVDSEGAQHSMKLTTLKKTFKKVEKEIEVEEPKTEDKPMTKHQQDALKNICHGYNWVIGGLENSVQDGDLEALPPVEDMFVEVYDEVTSCTFDKGFCDSKKAPICMKFAGKAFIREQIAKLFREDGYEVPEDLIKVPAKKQGHSNIIDGERVNLRKDEAEKVVTVRAFTGMLIGTFKVEKETKSTITVKTAKGTLKFDKNTGLQITDKKRFSNRIDL